MREEENFARDVYQALNAKWNHQTFSNTLPLPSARPVAPAGGSS